MRKLIGPNLISGIIASLVFLALFILIEWPLIISLVIAIGTFVGVYYLTKPVMRIGDVELTQLADGIELNNIYIDASNQVHQLQQTSSQIINPDVKAKASGVSSIGQDILAYLENHPREISKSRHFLTYYIPTANKIVDNYLHLKRANVSEDKFQLITERTNESLDLLKKIFAEQRDGYHKDRLTELEVQSELLEKTIKLGGGDH